MMQKESFIKGSPVICPTRFLLHGAEPLLHRPPVRPVLSRGLWTADAPICADGQNRTGKLFVCAKSAVFFGEQLP
jgi:hypothetical protein